MASCKSCDAPISWKKISGRWVTHTPDGSATHKCGQDLPAAKPARVTSEILALVTAQYETMSKITILHFPDDVMNCLACGASYPCKTTRMLTAGTELFKIHAENMQRMLDAGHRLYKATQHHRCDNGCDTCDALATYRSVDVYIDFETLRLREESQ